jgi:hypothetical protein
MGGATADALPAYPPNYSGIKQISTFKSLRLSLSVSESINLYNPMRTEEKKRVIDL